MRIVIMSDPHLGKFWKINNSVSNRANKLFDYFIRNLKLHSNKDTTLIIAGDVYDSIHANLEMLIKFRKPLDNIFKDYYDVKIIAGNHEVFIDKNGSQLSLLELGLSNQNNVITRGIESYKVDNTLINLILIPFQREYDKLLEDVPNYYENDKFNIVIGHETPKEIFSYSKIEMKNILKNYKSTNISCIIFGHYHKPKYVKVLNTDIISIGNSYYLTIDDIRDYDNEDYKKRYILISSYDEEDEILEEYKDYNCKLMFTSGVYSFFSIEYILPKVYKIHIKDQTEFNNKIDDMRKIKDSDSDSIFFIEGESLIDYSQAMFEGCDVYFDLINKNESSLLPLDENKIKTTNEIINSSKTLQDKWNTFMSGCNLTATHKKLASYLFDKRDDCDIIDNILKMSKIKG